MKILEVAPFSAGVCGLWARIHAESQLLAKKHNVYVFSSNIKRGSGKHEIADVYEEIGGVKIHRFPARFHIGENTYFWNFEKDALKLKPDVIITHAYRHFYSSAALKISKKLKIPCFLVTHAPFVELKTRGFYLSLLAFLYDKLIGKNTINSYDKVLTITKWELPYLLKIGCKKEKIEYSPNGVPDEFFKIKSREKNNGIKKILFLGRVAPIKDIETLIKAVKLLRDAGINVCVEIVGPIEEEYGKTLRNLIHKYNVTNIQFLGPVYDLKTKINIIDTADVFVLPSKREAMPQALIEAMARGKIIIASKTLGSTEIIKDCKNGFLFDIGNAKQLSEKVAYILKNYNKLKNIKKEAIKTSKQFAWSVLIKKIEDLVLSIRT